MFRHSRSGFVCRVDRCRLSVPRAFAGKIVGARKMSFSTEFRPSADIRFHRPNTGQTLEIRLHRFVRLQAAGHSLACGLELRACLDLIPCPIVEAGNVAAVSQNFFRTRNSRGELSRKRQQMLREEPAQVVRVYAHVAFAPSIWRKISRRGLPNGGHGRRLRCTLPARSGEPSAMSNPCESYEQRIVVYADIIGWKAACNDPSRYSGLRQAVEATDQYARNFSREVKEKVEMLSGAGVPAASIDEHASFEFSLFSDNFAVSAPSRYAEKLFTLLAFAIHSLLNARFLVRGGAALGPLHHRGNVLFGPALIEAVELEKRARYPRLLCGPSLVQFHTTSPDRNKMIIQDQEQDWVVNIACGGPDALHHLNGILESGLETLRLEEYAEVEKKWSYLRDMLPQMFRAKGIPG
jgi:hypothetical protein